MAARLDMRERLWHLALAALAVMLGVGAGMDPRVAVAAAIGLGFVVLVMGNLTAGLALFAVIAFLDVLPELGGSLLSFTKVVGFLLALSWLARVSTTTDTRNDFVGAHPTFTYVLAVFVGWAALSLTWAESSGDTNQAVMRFVLNLVLFLIVFTAVRTPRQFMFIVGAYVLGSAVAAGYGLLNPPEDVAYYDVSRVSGTVGDPNELAGVLVGGTILSAGLAMTLRGFPLLRVSAAVASVLCAGGIFLSLSRGGLVALAFSLVAAIFVAGRWRYQAIGLAVLMAVGAFTYFSFYASEDASDRVTRFGRGTGRADIWTVGWRMVEAHPVRGVGAGNFQTASIHFLLEPGSIKRDEFIVDTPKVAHNTYLQVLSELGAVGLALFVSILAFSLLSILRAARIFEKLGDQDMELMARALLVAICGTLAADFFISEEYSKQLWLLLGLGPAVLGVATARRNDAPVAEVSPSR